MGKTGKSAHCLSYTVQWTWYATIIKRLYRRSVDLWCKDYMLYTLNNRYCVCMCIDLMICNDTLHGVPLLLLANKQDLDVSCFLSLLPYHTFERIVVIADHYWCWPSLLLRWNQRLLFSEPFCRFLQTVCGVKKKLNWIIALYIVTTYNRNQVTSRTL